MTLPSSTRRQVIHSFAIVGFVLALFGNTLRFDFVWDDKVLLVPVEVYRNFDVARILFSLANGLEYLPVRDLSYALDFAIWGEKPFGFHLTNVVLFASNCVLLYLLVSRLIERLSDGRNGRIALLAALMFAAHPIQSEVVSFVTCRNVLLSGVFSLLSCLFFVKYLSREGSSSRWPYLVSLATYVLALFSKATSIALPGVLLLLMIGLLPRGRRRVASIIPFALLSIGAFVLFRAIATETSMIDTSQVIVYGSSDAITRIALAVQIPFFYLAKIFWPVGYSAEYTVSFRSSLGEWTVFLAFAALLATAAVALTRARTKPGFLLVFGSYLICLVPVLNFFATNPVVADRYVFLAFCPVTVACAALLYAAKRFLSARVVRSLAGVLILTLSGLTVYRSSVWRTDGSLWEATIRTSPDARNAYVNLASYYFNRGDKNEAFRVLGDLAEIHGDDTSLRHFEALDAFNNGRPGEVVEKLRPVVARKAVKPLTHLLLGRAQEQEGDFEAAIATYLDALARRVQDPGGDLATIRGRLHVLQERVSGTLAPLRKQVGEAPSDPNPRAQLAIRLDTLGLYGEALENYLKLIDAGNENWQVWFNIANIYKKTGRTADAVLAYEKSLALHPHNPNGWNNLAVVLKQNGNHERAVAAFERALELEPGFEKPLFNLARLYFSLGDRKKALRYFNLAVESSPELSQQATPYLRQLE